MGLFALRIERGREGCVNRGDLGGDVGTMVEDGAVGGWGAAEEISTVEVAEAGVVVELRDGRRRSRGGTSERALTQPTINAPPSNN